MFRKLIFPLVIVTLSAVASHAKDQSRYGEVRPLSPEQAALVQQAIAREKTTIEAIRQRAPLVETYIQNMRPDPVLGQVPDSDQHFLGRVEFNKIIGDNAYQVNEATSKGTKNEGKFGFLKHPTAFLGGLELPKTSKEVTVPTAC